ncbi:MAG: SIR2 family protein [Anaerolineaceae bacterium]
MIEIPLGLRTSLQSGNCVLFLGSGIGEHLHTPDGHQAPDGRALAKELAEEFSVDINNEEIDLSRVAGVVELRHGRPEMIAFLQKRLQDLTPDESLQWLFKLRWAAIYTTNYDRAIQRAYELISNPPQKPVTVAVTSELIRHDPRFEVPIFHLHGALFNTNSSQILITEDDYSRFRERRRMLFELLKFDFAASPFLYIGYANRDQNWRILITELLNEFNPSPIPQSFRIAPSTDPLEKELLIAKNVLTIDCSYQEFYETASSFISVAPMDSDRYRAFEKDVPSDLRTALEINPAATMRLLSSWTYVNQAPFHEKPNIQSFLRGNRPNWGLVGTRETFERDIEETIYEDLLDFYTSTSKKPHALLVLAPAGYGVSTLLMTLAARLVKESDSPVFMAKPGYPVLEGDIEYSTSLFDSTPFLFIDNASDNVTAVHTMLHRLEDLGKPAMFVLGERLNEWRQGHGKLNVKEYQINQLSDPEIFRLIDLLEKHSELGVLTNLDKELQFNVIKQKHGKELLVALREATEGKSFDAIIEDEFRGIQSSLGRRLYLAVSCFHQHGAYARDTLLAQLLETPLMQLYDNTNLSTEGVIFYECINPNRESYAARTRHRTIATVLWERCASSEEKDELLSKSLSCLNLNYGIDKAAFDSFIRSDHSIDQLRTLESKIRFFEIACKKDPDSPYVRQHYARMLLREGKEELALSQIESAIKINPRVRVLYHTRGMIFMQMAHSVKSDDIARRRLAQSEESFRRGLALYLRDEYCYQGLAQLYIGWAKRAPSVEESTEYIRKAEEVIGEGLHQVQVRYGLWIESSNIQDYLGNQPSRLKQLEQALRDTPGSIITRYLLGKAYRREGKLQGSIEVLKPNILNHPDEFRSFVEYAIAIAILNRSYTEAIAILRLSTLYGFSDPRFIATLGGMLFMNGNFSEAADIFNESIKHEFNSEELNEIQFTPWVLTDPEQKISLTGKVVTLKPGYALIEVEGYPRFLCPGSNFGGLLLNEGMRISFTPVFSAKGPLAINPHLIS